jgi:hypothetical protein
MIEKLINKYYEGHWLFDRKMVFIYGAIFGAVTISLK